MPQRSTQLVTLCANPVALLGIAVIAGGIYLAASVRADPDLWGHILFGRDIVAAGHVARVDPYSFTSDREWVNHEWLAEVVLYAAWSAARAPGLMLLKFAVVAATVGLLWRRSPRLGIEARLSLVALVTWSAANRLLTARPQVFSLLCFALLLFLLHSSEKGRRVIVAAATAGLFALWANLHGGWIVGLGVTTLWAAATLVGRRDRRHLAAVLAIPAAALLGSLATPYGVAKWQFLVDTVSPHRPAIADWLPAWSAPGLLLTWIPPAAATAWSLTRRPLPPLPWAAVSIALGVLALRVSRLDMFFGLSTAWMICSQFERSAPAMRRPATPPPASARFAMCGATLLAAVLVAVLVVTELRSNARCIPMTSSGTPHPEAEAIAVLQNRPPGEKVFTFFDYGEYAIWHLAPRHTISIDGRRETVYSDRLVARHMAFYDDAVRDPRFPEALGATLVWLPRSLGAADSLHRQGWHVIFDGPVTTIWSRQPASSAGPSPVAVAPRCFPGP